MTEIVVVIMAAGKGTRMKSPKPKVLHEMAGKAILAHVADAASGLDPKALVLVTGPESGDLSKHAGKISADKVYSVVQHERLGTAHAAIQALPVLEKLTADTVIVLNGDTPLVTPEAINELARMRAEEGAGMVVLGFEADDPAGYGRLVVENGDLSRIVEHKDATEDERAIALCNAGMMAFDGARLGDWLSRVGNDNAQGEYYLPDVVALAVADGCRVAVAVTDEDTVQGVNSRRQLAACEQVFQQRMREQVLDNGVTMEAPDTVFFAHDTKIASDVHIEPNVVFAQGVVIESGARIRAFSHLEGCTVGADSVVGPYARLRPGANLAEGTKIGNFVEIKKAEIEKGAKVNHLTYIGDARIGEGANIGAGTITCNYDGFNKHHTDIGAGAFIGSNTALVAPVTIGAGATVGAGSTVTKSVEADALAITRAPQKSLAGMAASLRKKYQAEKESK